MAKASGTTRRNAPSANPNLKGAGNTNKQMAHPDFVLHPKLSIDNRDKAIEFIMQNGGFSSAEAEDIFESVNRFTKISVYIREYQLTGKVIEPEEGSEKYAENAVKDAANIEKFIEKMPKWHGGETYRGLRYSFREDFEKLEVGDIWNSNHISSWTSKKSVGEDFAYVNGVMLRCKKPQNGTSVRFLSDLSGEYEVACSSRCRYKVVGKSIGEDNILIVDVEPISNGKIRKE